MMTLAFLILIGSTAWASRKSDSVRLLIAEKRYVDAQIKCIKWSATENDAETSLREYCAQAFWPKSEELDTIAAWQEYQNQWAGTDWAKKGFEREGIVALRSLADTSPEDSYLEIVEQFSGYKVAEKALKKAGDAAIRDAQSHEDAKRVVQVYGEHENIIDLAYRFPEEFVTIGIDGYSVSIKASTEMESFDADSYFWALRSDGEIKNWDDVVKKHLEDAGIEPVAVMRKVQNHKGDGPVFPLCPISGVTETAEIGIAIPLADNFVFEPADWEENCSLDKTAVAIYSQKQLQYFSFSSGYNLDFGLKKGGRKNFTTFVRRTGDTILFEDSIFVPVGKSFVRYPLSGTAPWLTDKPPGGLRYTLDTTLRGAGIPTGWGIQGVPDGIQITTSLETNWNVPSGEMRFFSPLVLDLLGMSGFEEPLEGIPVVEWDVDIGGIYSAPLGSVPMDIRKLTEQEIKGTRYHIGGAGLDPYQLNVVDGFAVDLDNDRKAEKVIRAVYKEREVVLILDVDEKLGNRTFIYSTDHAINGKSVSATPFAIKVGEQVAFGWSGVESKKTYFEMIYSQNGAFVIKE